MQKLLKVLRKDLRSPFQNFQFEIGKKYHCNNFNNNKNQDCAEGFYATEIEGLLYSLNTQKDNRVFQSEVSGRKVEINQFKRRYEDIEIIKETPLSEIKKLAQKQEKKLGYKLSEALFPYNPLRGEKTEVTEKDLINLRQWSSIQRSAWQGVGQSVQQSVQRSVGQSVQQSVQRSIGQSVWQSVWQGIGESVWGNIWQSVRESVWQGIGESVWQNLRQNIEQIVGGYISSFFPNIKKWEYIDHKEGVNPFQAGIDLWMRGLVPSFDGKIWRLHSGQKAEIVYNGGIK